MKGKLCGFSIQSLGLLFALSLTVFSIAFSDSASATSQAHLLTPSDQTWTEAHEAELLEALVEEGISKENASIVIVQNTSRTANQFQALISDATNPDHRFTFYKYTSGGFTYYRIGVPNSSPTITGYNITATGHAMLDYSQMYESGGTFDTTLGNPTIFIDPIRHDYYSYFWNTKYHTTWDQDQYADEAYEVLKPHFTFSVDDKKIKATYNGNLGGTPTMFWTLDLPPNPINDKIGTVYEFEVADYGEYNLALSASYLYTVNPYADQMVNIQPNFVTLDIDGSSFAGNTALMDCSESFCETPIYEDCSLTDIMCHFRNFGAWLKQWLGIEQWSDITESPFSTFESDTHGLTSVITAPLSFYEDLNAGTCTPITLPLPAIGNVNVPCMSTIYSANFGAFYTIAQTIVNAVVGYYVMVRILEIVKGIKDPQNDRIEVSHL